MDGLRELHKLDSAKFSTPVLAYRFKISPEAVRRILKSKWAPSSEKRVKWAMQDRRRRTEKTEYRKQVALEEIRETNEILLAKQFQGGLTLNS
jgi:hypothetical protein